MTFDDVSGHSYNLPAMTRMNVPVLQIILVRLVLKTYMSVTSLSLVHNIVAMYFLHNHKTEIEIICCKRQKNTPCNGYRHRGSQL